MSNFEPMLDTQVDVGAAVAAATIPKKRRYSKKDGKQEKEKKKPRTSKIVDDDDEGYDNEEDCEGGRCLAILDAAADGAKESEEEGKIDGDDDDDDDDDDDGHDADGGIIDKSIVREKKQASPKAKAKARGKAKAKGKAAAKKKGDNIRDRSKSKKFFAEIFPNLPEKLLNHFNGLGRDSQTTFIHAAVDRSSTGRLSENVQAMWKLCIQREEAQRGAESMSGYIIEDPATTLTSSKKQTPTS